MPKLNELTIVTWVTEATKVAAQVVKDKASLKDLLGKARKMTPLLAGVAGDAGALIRMVRASTRGQYTELPRSTLLLAVGALVYLVTPLDIFLDPILIDDGVVIGWVVAKVKADIERFRAWEEVAATLVEVEDKLDAASPELPQIADAQKDSEPIASVWLTESTIRQLLLQAIPPKIRFLLRDVQVVIDRQQVHIDFALAPAGRLAYAVTLPRGEVALAQGELRLTVESTTAGLVGRPLAVAMKGRVSKFLQSRKGPFLMEQQDDQVIVRWDNLLVRMNSIQLMGLGLSEAVSLVVEQAEGVVRVDVYSALVR